MLVLKSLHCCKSDIYILVLDPFKFNSFRTRRDSDGNTEHYDEHYRSHENYVEMKTVVHNGPSLPAVSCQYSLFITCSCSIVTNFFLRASIISPSALWYQEICHHPLKPTLAKWGTMSRPKLSETGSGIIVPRATSWSMESWTSISILQLCKRAMPETKRICVVGLANLVLFLLWSHPTGCVATNAILNK